MSKLPILVTGANGFLGSEIVRQMITAGHNVRATDKDPNCLIKEIEYVQADITQTGHIMSAVAGVATVIHGAGFAHVIGNEDELAERFRQINEFGAANVAEAAAESGVKHFVLISSVSVYGPSASRVCSEIMPCCPSSQYAKSKLNAERRVLAVGQQSGMMVTILRFATVYGEGDPGNVGRLIRSLERRCFISIGDGSNNKSLLYKGDAARACLAVLKTPPNGCAIYNVSGQPCKIHEIVEILIASLGKRPFIIRIPVSVAAFTSRLLARLFPAPFSRFSERISKWLADDIIDTHRIESEIGYKTQVDLTDGLNRQVRWLKNQTLKQSSVSVDSYHKLNESN